MSILDSMNKGRLLKVLRVNPSWKVQKMILVGREYKELDTKYRRFYKKVSKFQAHYVEVKEPKVGDDVWVYPIRPVSSSKRHIAWLRNK